MTREWIAHPDLTAQADAKHAFEVELKAYRERAKRAQRAYLHERRPQAPRIRPYTGWEHLLTLISPHMCGLCDAPLGAVSRALCTRCEEHTRPRETQKSFGPVWSLFEHDTLSRRAVSRLKYHGERWRGHQLAQHLAIHWLAHMQDAIDADDLLIPIPLNPQRIRQRGFNQAAVIAQGMQSRLELKSCHRTLFRHQGMQRDQKSLRREDRLKNRGLFFAKPLHTGQRVWLVDDVITTGTTLEDAASTLEKAGLTPVGAITLTWTY